MSPTDDTLASARDRMVEHQLAARDIRSRAVLEAMAAVPREAFVPPKLADQAYLDSPLPIGEGQTISQPYIVARMVEALDLSADDRVLEIGTGSGYAAAVLAEVAGKVFTVERHATLATEAEERLERLGYENVAVRHGDGTKGWPDHAPYDAIVVAAGGPDVPQSLVDQLAVGGRLVIPVGSEVSSQVLLRLTKSRDGESLEREDLGLVRFVPLVGEEGW